MAIGKSIRVYLADATVTGIRYAELVNWTGHAIACPRNRLKELLNWSEVAKPGVYFLCESRYSDAKPIVYIGESENVLQRLTSHDRNKEFWNEVIIFTSKDENLTKAHIKYLEATLVELSKQADRCQLENGNSPPESSLPRADRDAMVEFIENIRMVLGILGYPILEAILKTKNESQLVQLPDNSYSQGLTELTFSIKNVVARGFVTDEGFVLNKGSQLLKENAASLPKKLVAMKAQLLQTGSLEEDNNKFVTNTDILFSSSSYAAAIVAGTARSGPESWKTATGKTLKQTEDEALRN